MATYRIVDVDAATPYVEGAGDQLVEKTPTATGWRLLIRTPGLSDTADGQLATAKTLLESQGATVTLKAVVAKP